MVACKIRHCIALPCLALTFLSPGCSGTSSPDPVHLKAAPETSVRNPDPPSSGQAYDFGTIIAEDQTLRHEFVVGNPTDRPIRLIRGMAMTPCCSTIGPLPESIAPRGEARIPATFKPGYQSGVKQVQFLIETDSADRRAIGLALQARLVSAWESEPIAGSTSPIPLGQSRQLTFRVIARRRGSTGRDLPEAISAAPPIDARFADQGATRTDPDGSIEAARDVIVSIPAANRPGIKRGEICFRWPDGRLDRMPLTWEVRPRLRVAPAGLVLRHSRQPASQAIAIESDGRPFRVTDVVSPLLSEPAALPEKPGTRHTIKLSLDLSKAVPDRAANITIATDHPDQSSVELSVLILPRAKGEGDES